MEVKSGQQSVLSSTLGNHELDFNSELSDESDVENELSELERKITAIDLNVSSTQRSLEDLYRYKTEPDVVDLSQSPKPSFLRRARSLLDRFGRRTLPTTITIKTPSLPGDLDNALVQQTEDALQRLIRERHVLATGLKRRQAALSFRNGRLPVELWAKIFLLCLPDEEFVTPKSNQAPLLLCQICSQWRSIAVGTPLLWNTLSIRTSWSRRIWKSSVECWLNRSANALLYLDISIPAFMEEGYIDYDHWHVLKSIMDTADRWHHLRLNLSNNLLGALLNNHMPLLQTLEFNTTEHITSLNLHLLHVPNLKIITAHSKAVYLQHMCLPWTQLTHLSSQCWLNISQHVEILTNCLNLQSYTMNLIHSDLWWDVNKLVHRRLHVLHITSFVEDTTAANVDFDLLQLPNLAELTLVIPNESPGYGVMRWPKTEILSLIQRSSCTLSKLRFKGFAATEDDILNAQKAIPLPTVIEFQC